MKLTKKAKVAGTIVIASLSVQVYDEIIEILGDGLITILIRTVAQNLQF